MKTARITTEVRQGGLCRFAVILDKACIRPIFDEIGKDPLTSEAVEEISNINILIGDSNRVLGEGVKAIGIMMHHLAINGEDNSVFGYYGPDLGVLLEEMGDLIIGLKSSQELVNMAVEKQLNRKGGAQ